MGKNDRYLTMVFLLKTAFHPVPITRLIPRASSENSGSFCLMKLVNIVSQIPSSLWERELPRGLSWSFTHSNTPVDAEIHVIYGLRQPLRVPNSWENTVFVASEPPDIRAHNISILSLYRAVLGPPYEYLAGTSNFSPVTAVAPLGGQG